MPGFPDEVVEPVGQFVSRGDMQRYTHTDRRIRDRLGCHVGCLAGHVCYPAADGCIVGEQRGHCCQFHNTAHYVNFLRAVVSMRRVATSNRNTSRQGPASDDFIQDLGALIPQNLVYNNNPRPFSEDDNLTEDFPTLDFRLADDTSTNMTITAPLQHALVSLGSKLFKNLFIKFYDNIQRIYEIDDSIRSMSNIYIELKLSHAPPFIVPIDVLSIARNMRLCRLPYDDGTPVLTEQLLFDIIRHKLETADASSCAATVDMAYTNIGHANFNPVVAACARTRFRGRIICRIAAGTNITTGAFNGVSISVINTLHGRNMFNDLPHFFHHVDWNAPSRLAVCISRSY